MEKKFIIIDGNSLINRAYFAITTPMKTKDGIYTQGIYGFLNMLEKVRKEHKPDMIGVAFDVKSPTFRHNMYDEYKSGRKKMDLELAMQFPLLKEVLGAMNIKCVELEGYEADDLIGTLARRGAESGFRAIIITGDKDALQLIDDKTEVIFTKKGISEFKRYDRNSFEDEYGFAPIHMIDYKSIFGDKSDNIPGVRGIGKVGATNLIKKYKTLENIYENIDDIEKKSIADKLSESHLDAFLSKRLATIDTNVPIDVSLDEFNVADANDVELARLLKKLEFKSFLKKMNLVDSDEKDNILLEQFEKIIVCDEAACAQCIEEIKVADNVGIKLIDSEEEKEKLKRENGLFAFLLGKKLYAVPRRSKHIVEIFRAIENSQIAIWGHQLRNEIVHMMEAGIRSFNIGFDTAIAQYIIDSGRSDYSLEKLALDDNVDLKIQKSNEQLSFGFAAEESYKADFENLEKQMAYIGVLQKRQREKIKEENLNELFYNLEIPLVEVMAYMQYIGFKVDRDKLTSVGAGLKERLSELTEKIYEIAGEEFNINSPKQLGVILFEKLSLPSGKKTKTGYSTNAEILEKIRDENPIIPLILEYRKISKLVSTYIDGLNAVICKDGKIHSQFNQTITTTGRISSSNPNMQNIPVRDELGRTIRGAFVPTDENFILMGADYSQIELRVLAHMSEDSALIESFNRGEDIHKATAARMMGVTMDEVTSAERSSAKAINFGVIYGMGAFSLSEDLNISWNEAEKYISEYFQKHKAVKQFMDRQIENAKEKGFVNTILGRKRYIPEINAKNMIVRQLGKRLAMNTPIQGSAADIIKIAMRRVYDELSQLKSRLILQVHDELIIETHKDEADTVKEILRKSMEEAVKLNVELKVDINIGENWLELK